MKSPVARPTVVVLNQLALLCVALDLANLPTHEGRIAENVAPPVWVRNRFTNGLRGDRNAHWHRYVHARRELAWSDQGGVQTPRTKEFRLDCGSRRGATQL